MTYAVTGESAVELVSVDSSVILGGAAEGGEAEGSDEGHASEAGAASLALPESVAYEGADYALASIAPYAFYLSGVTDVTLPATVIDVDDRAFRSSDVANVSVAEANPTYSSFDGALYSAGLTSLLLIPGGRQGAVRIPSQASDVPASAFSHCALVTAISVDAGGAHLSSWEGLLYDADGTTLLRVPAGATEIAIREGCTTIAAGAMEACASLERINAPSTVTSISPDVFTAIPTVSLLAASLAGADDPGTAGESSSQDAAPQLNAMVALSSTDDSVSAVDASAVTAYVPEDADKSVWEQHFAVEPMAKTQDMTAYGSGEYITGFFQLHEGGAYWSDGDPANYKSIVQEVGAQWRLPAAIPKLDDTVFISWYLGSSPVSTGGAVPSGGNAWLVPGWLQQCIFQPNDSESWSDGTPFQNTVDIRRVWTSGIPLYIEFPEKRPIKTGYQFAGWQDGNGNVWVTGNRITMPGSLFFIPKWTPNSYTVEYWNKSGTAKLSSDASFKYDTARNLAARPSSGVSTGHTAVGWATSTNQTTANYGFGSSQKNLVTSGTKKLYLAETANPYAIAFDSQGGPEVPSISATYDQDVTLPAPGARNGYRFLGWNTEADGSGTAYQVGVALAKPNLATSGEAKLFAQWDAVISAVVPLEVQAQVDVLGLEAPKEAQGCIESRCGEPLKVAEVKLTPLDGAKELFGEGNVSDVFLEVLANNGASPNARFSLGSSATESDASKLQALTMASYGTRVPISYRFAMAPEVQTSLVEYADPQPVCTVAYTVALQNAST